MTLKFTCLDGCHTYFDGATYFWMFETTPCGEALNLYMSICVACSVMAAIMMCDFTTLLFLRHYRNQQSKLVLTRCHTTVDVMSSLKGHGWSHANLRKRRPQGCVQHHIKQRRAACARTICVVRTSHSILLAGKSALRAQKGPSFRVPSSRCSTSF